jgi:nucleoid-associated protein YgaU
MFVRGSRYENVAEAINAGPGGRQISYKRLRLIPLPPAFQVYRVTAGDRLDLVAFHFYQDPEQYWRICDANRALLPEDLMREAGRRLSIPQPQS